MRAQLLVTALVAIGISASASAQMVRPVPMTPTYPVVIAPMPLPQTVPVQSPTLTPAITPTLTPTLPPAPTVSPAPAPAVALAPGGLSGGSCKTTDDCVRETTQCLANKLATHEDANATRFFVQYQQDGTPAVFYPIETPPTDDENAEAAECADELRACLAQRCGR